MRQIAIIEKNRCNFDRMEEFALPLLYTEYDEHNEEERIRTKNSINDYIWSVIEPYIKFVDVGSGDDLMTIVCENLANKFPDRKLDEFFYHTETSYSFPKKFIEIIYCQPNWKEYDKSCTENMNNLACLFSLKHNAIENNCIILVNDYDLGEKYFATIGSTTKEDILRVIRRRFFFSAVVIKDENISKYYYQNPSYLVKKVFKLDEKDNIQKLSFDLLKYNLVFYFQFDNSNKTKYVNKIATRVNGLYPMYGDVIVLHEMEENIFLNISLHEIKRLNVLSYGRLCDRKLNPDEIHTTTIVDVGTDGKPVEKKITPFWSKYLILNSRMNRWQENKNKCINCQEEINKLIICERCYRAKYCSTKCVKDFNSYHYEECINPDCT
ncbi:MAG: hypothetical protein Satyrvirus4_27 [Satyrvirus sp.]|uniref:MYND-type domain-containing protein n=1 Tax=Satyrvirus sp. TaxID=2487771 RepID=A0A3G5AD81_9VIRU|nr:MAG: hypothetical protein Satyrvirus4_27 [Satyrvirus sp.]